MAGTGGTTAGEHLHAVRRRSVRLLRPQRNPAGLVVALLASTGLSLAAGVTAGLAMGSPVGRVPYRRLVDGVGAVKWSDPVVFAVALVAMAAGGALLLLAALPGRTRLVPLESADSRMVIGLTRAGLRRTLRAAAESVDEVSRARVRLGSRNIEVTVFTGADRTGHLLRQVGTVVGDRLTALGAMCGGEVVVRLRRRGV
ncbi:hypothetical protein GCM10017600_14110 [Streptosporangium carneum]|uniref:DUF6286 domain-containing protein n=1 Tax=Streptosporangium carneum TaxID=47481 RepID=A0A9W6MBC8_9ACTN|nr:hypothetical protein GCM10017600_14110 [Streptosporangium carneum]